jgi:hypothetical protein
MNETLQAWIRSLEAEWSKPEGFLGKAREGVFDHRKAADFVTVLKSIKVPVENTIDRRLVALLWYIPIFLRWQKERVAEKGGDTVAFDHLANQVQGIVEAILGIP